MGEKGKFATWKTIHLGTIKDVKDFWYELEYTNCNIGFGAGRMLMDPNFKIADQETTLELVRITVADLGFDPGAKIKDVYKEAEEQGLALCPPEVGPQLRFQYLDQPMDEWIFIAMNPLISSENFLDVWLIERDMFGFWLSSLGGKPDDFWYTQYNIVFTRK